MKRPSLLTLAGPLFIVAAAIVLLVCEHTMLFRAQELSLWLPTRLWLENSLAVPAGGVIWLSELLTQCFYYPWLGTLLLAGLWLAAYYLVNHVYKVPSTHRIVALVPVALLMGCAVEAGYWIFHIKTPGYLFSAAIGFDFALLLTWLLRELHNMWWRMGGIVVSAIALFPLFGFYALLALLLTALLTATRDKEKGRWVLVALVLACVIAVPMGWHEVFTTSRLDSMYLAGLPAFKLTTAHLCFWAPYLLLVVVLMAGCVPFFGCKTSNIEDKHPQPYTQRKIGLMHGTIVLVCALLVVVCWYKDPCFHAELKMEAAMEQGDYAAVLRTAKRQDQRAARAIPSRMKHEAALIQEKHLLEGEMIRGTLSQAEYDKQQASINKRLNRIYRQTQPSRLIVMLRNLALLKTGKLGQEMFHYAEGGSLPTKPFDIMLVQSGGKMLYYHYAMFNYCYRWCMEDGVEYGWKTEYLKYMVRCALLSGDMAVAQKYNNILAQTLFHRRWAKEMQLHIDNPEMVAQDKEFAAILPLYCYLDLLDGDQSLVEMYLLNFFGRSFSDDTSPLFAQAGMMSALMLKDTSLYWKNFRRYLTAFPNDPMPVHFQEAALLFGNLEPGRVDVDRMPFDPKVRMRFDAFRDFAAKNALGEKPEENVELRERFRKKFGNTYYYFYFFVNNVRTY